MLMKLICSVSSNQSLPSHDYPPDCRVGGGGEASLLVSPLVVAGIVIGLVLLLSCVTIIVGSLRKDSRLHNPHLRQAYADGLSYGGSLGELRSTCMEEFSPTFDFDSYTESLSQSNMLYSDSPPQYEECVGPGATQIYTPTDDPPPYSLTDPCQQGQETPYRTLGSPAGASWLSPSASSHYPIRLQDLRQQPIASVSLSTLPQEDAPPYESVVGIQNQPLPLMPLDLLKHQSEGGSPQRSMPHRIL